MPYRSEEHTSELQSHSNNSYAVFCLKTGNYECAYALGILNAQLGLPEITEYEDIAALKEQLLEKAADYKTEDAGLKQMVHLLKEYEAAPVADEQMRELFTMGFHDKNL